LFGAAANFAVYALLIGYAPWPFKVPYIALLFGVLVGMVFNFTLSKKLVFRGSA
jgi:putative flippase GtrA